MKRFNTTAAAILAVALLGCQQEKATPLSEYESADVAAAAYNFQVYPGATFLPHITDLLRKAHFAIHPQAKEAPPIAVYETSGTVEEVAGFYAERYGYGPVAPDASNAFSAAPPGAYFTAGDLQKDAQGAKPVMEKMKIASDISKAVGNYRGAHVNPTENFPRVTIQRPYFDIQKSTVVDKTLIIMVKE